MTSFLKPILVAVPLLLAACTGIPADPTVSEGPASAEAVLLTVLPMYWEGEAASVSPAEPGPRPANLLRDIELAPGEVAILARESCNDGVVRGWGLRCVAFTVGGNAYVSLTNRVIIAVNRGRAID